MRAKDFRDIARAALANNWGLSIGITLVAGLLGASVTGYGGGAASASYSSSRGGNSSSSTGVVGGPVFRNEVWNVFLSIMMVLLVGMAIVLLVRLIFGGATTLGLRKYYIDLVSKREPVRFNTLFSRYTYFGRGLLLNFLVGLFLALWALLLIAPGMLLLIYGSFEIYSGIGYSMFPLGMLLFLGGAVVMVPISLRYSMSFYIMTQDPEGVTAMEAIRRSKEMMKGNKGRLFCLQLSFIGWSLLAALTCGIGVLWLNPYMAAAEATFYLDLTGQLPGQPNAAPPNYSPYGMPPQGGMPPYGAAPYAYGPPPAQPPYGAMGQPYQPYPGDSAGNPPPYGAPAQPGAPAEEAPPEKDPWEDGPKEDS